MRFNCSLTKLSLNLRKQHHTRAISVLVLSSKQIVHLHVIPLLTAHTQHIVQQFIVIYASDGIAVHIVLLVCALQLVKSQHLHLLLLKIKQTRIVLNNSVNTLHRYYICLHNDNKFIY